jgi:iron complex transport system substrate-binding protein
MPLFVTNPRSLQGIYKSIHDLGALSGHLAEARDLVRSLRGRERAITARSELRPQHTVAFIVSLQPLMLVGNGTFLSELLDLAGAVNIARGAASTYPTYSKESVVAQDPDIIMVMSDLLAEPRELAGLFPEWKHIDAVRSGKVFLVDPDIVSRPGPRAVDGLEAIFRILYHKSQ